MGCGIKPSTDAKILAILLFSLFFLLSFLFLRACVSSFTSNYTSGESIKCQLGTGSGCWLALNYNMLYLISLEYDLRFISSFSFWHSSSASIRFWFFNIFQSFKLFSLWSCKDWNTYSCHLFPFDFPSFLCKLLIYAVIFFHRWNIGGVDLRWLRMVEMAMRIIMMRQPHPRIMQEAAQTKSREIKANKKKKRFRITSCSHLRIPQILCWWSLAPLGPLEMVSVFLSWHYWWAKWLIPSEVTRVTPISFI